MRHSNKGRNNPMYGKYHSIETKAKIRDTKYKQFVSKYAENIDKMVELYKSGHSIKKIADMFDTNNRAVKKLLVHKKVMIRSQGGNYAK